MCLRCIPISIVVEGFVVNHYEEILHEVNKHLTPELGICVVLQQVEIQPVSLGLSQMAQMEYVKKFKGLGAYFACSHFPTDIGIGRAWVGQLGNEKWDCLCLEWAVDFDTTCFVFMHELGHMLGAKHSSTGYMSGYMSQYFYSTDSKEQIWAAPWTRKFFQLDETTTTVTRLKYVKESSKESSKDLSNEDSDESYCSSNTSRVTLGDLGKF